MTFYSYTCQTGLRGNVPYILPTKQPFWERPSELDEKAMLEVSLNSAHHRASFLVASSRHIGDWLFALPVASCGLRLDDEVMRVAVGSRLGLNLCTPHHFHCGSIVLSAAPGRSARHHALNDLVARSSASAGVPVTSVEGTIGD